MAKFHEKQRHAFLLTFFNESDQAGTIIEVNGFVLEKQWNGDSKTFQVAIYSKTSHEKRNEYKNETDLSWIK